jgi:hypothetical protein
MTGIEEGNNSYPLKDRIRLTETRHTVPNPVPNFKEGTL